MNWKTYGQSPSPACSGSSDGEKIAAIEKQILWLTIHCLAMVVFILGLLTLAWWVAASKDLGAMYFYGGGVTMMLCAKIHVWLERRSRSNVKSADAGSIEGRLE